MGFRAIIITVSDRGARGEREDLSGPEIARMLAGVGMEIAGRRIVPDEKELIRRVLLEGSDGEDADLIVTTGGTGVSPRDVTPDATLKVIEKEVPGFSEAMRAESLKKTPHAMISRAVSPEATREVIEKEIPGMAEAMRRQSSSLTPHAMLSRAVAGIRGRTLIINLPGSPKGARENLGVLLPALPHAIEKIRGDQRECAS